MSGSTLPALPASATLTGAELVYVVQGGQDKRTTAQAIANLAPPGTGTVTTVSVASANGLAISLRAVGERQAARELGEDTLARRRRVLGEDHPDTGASATFAIFLRTPRPLLKTIGWVSRRRRAG